jgi:hypothetical protein
MSDKPLPAAATKSFLLSKTFWLQIVAVASVMVPQVQAWLASNPVDCIAVFAAINVLVRFVTKGAVSIFPPEEKSGGVSGGMALLVLWLGLSMAVVGTLPSCVPGAEYPVTGSLAYTDPATGAQVGLAVGSPQAAKKPKRAKITVVTPDK